MKKKMFYLMMDLVWILGFILVLGLSMIPTLYLSKFVYEKVGINVLIMLAPVFVFLWINLYILVDGIIYFLFIPKLKEGNFKIPSKQWILWRLNWNLYSYVFLFFNRYMLFNKFIKTPYMNLMGTKVYYTTYFGETSDLQDLNSLISFGKDTLIGSEVTLATHLIISETNIIFKKITVGDGVVIGARSSLAPGANIGNNVILGYNITMSINVEIGDDTHIGALTVIDSGVKIGKKCRIGTNVRVEANSVIPDKTVIRDNTVWTQEQK